MMEPLVVYWVGSAVGAALFFGAGALMSRKPPTPSEQPQWERQLASVNAELTGARQQAAQADHLAQQLGQQREQSAGHAAAAERARAELAQAQQQLVDRAEIQRGLTEAAARGEQQQRKMAALTDAKRKAELAANELQKRVSQLEAGRASEQRAQHSQRDELAELRRVVAERNQQADQAALEALDKAKRENRELRVRQSNDEQRLQELTAYGDENARLRAQAEALQAAAERVPQLEKQIKDLATQLNAQRRLAGTVPPPPPRGAVAPPLSRGATDTDTTIEGMLSKRLRQLTTTASLDAAVIADAQGLLLAGVGDDSQQHTIAALASVALDVTQRAEEFLGLDPVEVIELVCGDTSALRVRLFRWHGQLITLATLGRAPLRRNEAEETVVTAFPSLVGAAG